MQVLIIGASGKTGQAILATLANTSHNTFGLIRAQAHEKLITQFNATPLYGDLQSDLSAISKKIDAIIFVAGSRGKNVEGVDYQGLVNAVDAAVNNGIKRFLYIGSINVGKTTTQFVKELEDYYVSLGASIPEGLLANTKKPGYLNYVNMKTKAETYLVNSGLNYTILRAGLLTLESGSGKVAVTKGTLHAFGKISRENVAACFVEALNNQNTYYNIFTILDGDEAIVKAFN